MASNYHKVLIGTLGGSTCKDGSGTTGSFEVGWGEIFTGLQSNAVSLDPNYPSFNNVWKSVSDLSADFPNLTQVTKNYGWPGGSGSNFTGYHQQTSDFYTQFKELINDNPKFVLIMLGQNPTNLNQFKTVIEWIVGGKYKDANGNFVTASNYSSPTVLMLSLVPQRSGPPAATCQNTSGVLIGSDGQSGVATDTQTAVQQLQANDPNGTYDNVYFIDNYAYFNTLFHNHATQDPSCYQLISTWVEDNIDCVPGTGGYVHYSPGGATIIANGIYEQLSSSSEAGVNAITNYKTKTGTFVVTKSSS